MSENNSKLYDEHFFFIERMKLLFKISPFEKDIIKTMSDLYRALEADHLIGIPMPKDYSAEDNATLKFLYEYYNA